MAIGLQRVKLFYLGMYNDGSVQDTALQRPWKRLLHVECRALGETWTDKGIAFRVSIRFEMHYAFNF